MALILAIALAFPYPYWLKLQTGRWMLSGKAPLNLMHAEAKRHTADHREELNRVYSQAFALTEDGKPAFLTGGPTFYNVIVRHPIDSMRVYIRNWWDAGGLVRFRTYCLLAAMALGVWESCRRWRVRRSRAVWWIPATSILFLLLPPLFVSMNQPSFHPERMFAPTLPLFLILASMGVNSVLRRGIGRRFISRQSTPAVLGVTLALITLTSFGFDAYRLNQQTKAGAETIARRIYVLQKWVERNLPPDAVMASTSLLDDLYLDHPTVWLPAERRIERLEAYLLCRSVEAVISDPGGGVYSPGLEGLEVKAYEFVNDSGLPQSLRVYKRQRSYHDPTTKLPSAE